MSTLAELRGRPHLSISQLKSFLICPRKYRLHYIDREAPAFRSSSLVLGSAIHHAAEDYFRNHDEHEPASRLQLQESLVEEISRELRRVDVPVLFDEGDDENKVMSDAAGMLDALLVGLPSVSEVIAVEEAFALDLVDDITGEVLPLPLVGAVDAVVVVDKHLLILELKTSRRRWSTDQLSYDPQVTAYRRWAKGTFSKDVGVLFVVVLRQKRPCIQVESPVRSECDDADLFATASSVLRGIEAGVDHPVRGWACKGCPFSHACR